MTDRLAERVVRRAIATMASFYAAAPPPPTAAKEMLVHALEGESVQPMRQTATLSRPWLMGLSPRRGGLDRPSVVALEDWDLHRPASPV
jgi:hypothetical protein